MEKKEVIKHIENEKATRERLAEDFRNSWVEYGNPDCSDPRYMIYAGYKAQARVLKNLLVDIKRK